MPSHSNLSLPLLSNPFAPPIHTFIALPLIPPLFTPSLSLLPIPICPLIPTPIALPLTPPPFPSPRMSTADLAGLVSRLETVTTRLETVAARGGGGGGGGEGGGGGRGRGGMEGRVNACVKRGEV